MPQASDELRAQMERRFGSPVNDTGPIQFLRNAGYTLNMDWTWSKSGISDLTQMTREEFDCLLFLQAWERVANAILAHARPREAELKVARQTAIDRLKDMLEGDDGHAWSEARKVLPMLETLLHTQKCQ